MLRRLQRPVGWLRYAQTVLEPQEVPKGMGVGSRESAGLPESSIKHVLGPQKTMMRKNKTRTEFQY